MESQSTDRNEELKKLMDKEMRRAQELSQLHELLEHQTDQLRRLTYARIDSDPTLRTRRALLGISFATIVVVAGGLHPTEIRSIGLLLDREDYFTIHAAIAAAIVYHLATFGVRLWKDRVRRMLEIQDLERSIRSTGRSFRDYFARQGADFPDYFTSAKQSAPRNVPELIVEYLLPLLTAIAALLAIVVAEAADQLHPANTSVEIHIQEPAAAPALLSDGVTEAIGPEP